MGETGVRGEGTAWGGSQAVDVPGRVQGTGNPSGWLSTGQGEGWSPSPVCFQPCLRLQVGIVLAFRCLKFCEILQCKSVIKKKKSLIF